MNFEVLKNFSLRSLLLNDLDFEYLKDEMNTDKQEDIYPVIANFVQQSIYFQFVMQILSKECDLHTRELSCKMLMYLDSNCTMVALKEIQEFLM